jgi:hypothetical protein
MKCKAKGATIVKPVLGGNVILVRIFVILNTEMCFSSGFEVKKNSSRMTSSTEN